MSLSPARSSGKDPTQSSTQRELENERETRPAGGREGEREPTRGLSHSRSGGPVLGRNPSCCPSIAPPAAVVLPPAKQPGRASCCRSFSTAAGPGAAALALHTRAAASESRTRPSRHRHRRRVLPEGPWPWPGPGFYPICRRDSHRDSLTRQRDGGLFSPRNWKGITSRRYPRHRASAARPAPRWCHHGA
jgi:hypothetical protein